MKNAIKMVLFFLGFIIFAVAFCVVLPDPYGRSYCKALPRQYDYYKQIDGNKIVFVGNSSLSFGFDEDYMEELTGKKCAILGNHAGYGMSYVMEMSKCNLKAGDIVIIEIVGNEIDTCGEALLLTAIGHKYDMYRFFIPEVRGKIIAYYPTYIKDSLMYNLKGGYIAEGSYSMDSYDSKGNMIYERKECEIPDPYTEEVAKTYGHASFSGNKWSEEWYSYVNDYIEYCSSIGVKVYLIEVCYYNKAVTSNAHEMDAYDQMLKENIKAPLISKQSDYIYERKYIYNAIAHCNTEGAKHRTEQIYQDMVEHKVI